MIMKNMISNHARVMVAPPRNVIELKLISYGFQPACAVWLKSQQVLCPVELCHYLWHPTMVKLLYDDKVATPFRLPYNTYLQKVE